MGDGIYSALSGAIAEARALEVAANNLANVSTTGFKKEKLSFREVLMGEDSTQRQVRIEPTGTDFAQGNITRTGGPLDAAILGPGFFAVSTPQGERYTRAGSFTLDPSGRLVTPAGFQVLGANGPVKVDTSEPVSIAPDGTLLSGTDPVARLKVVDFANPQALERLGDGLWGPSGQTPQPVADAKLEPGALEQSNVNAVEGMTELILISRAYEAFASTLQSYRQVDSRTTTELGR